MKKADQAPAEGASMTEKPLSPLARWVIVLVVFLVAWALATIYFAYMAGHNFIVVGDLISGFVWPAILAALLYRWLRKQPKVK